MKILIKPSTYTDEYKNTDGIILPLKDYSVDYDTYYTIDEIRSIRRQYNNEIFVVMNRMFMNSDIDSLTNILFELDSFNITGIFFYDLSVLQIKKELNLKTDLVWDSTHMVTNYNTCNYYNKKSVKYAVVSSEITIDEVLEIKEKSTIIPMFTMISYPTVAMSYRHLITNYNKMHNLSNNKKLLIEEVITKDNYILEENEYGTTFKYGKILNNTSVLSKLKEIDFPYIILNEDGISHDTFMKIYKNINSPSFNTDEISSLIGDNTGFLNRKTIYKVKK